MGQCSKATNINYEDPVGTIERAVPQVEQLIVLRSDAITLVEMLFQELTTKIGQSPTQTSSDAHLNVGISGGRIQGAQTDRRNRTYSLHVSSSEF
jgi:hypothetical protein